MKFLVVCWNDGSVSVEKSSSVGLCTGSMEKGDQVAKINSLKVVSK